MTAPLVGAPHATTPGGENRGELVTSSTLAAVRPASFVSNGMRAAQPVPRRPLGRHELADAAFHGYTFDTLYASGCRDVAKLTAVVSQVESAARLERRLDHGDVHRMAVRTLNGRSRLVPVTYRRCTVGPPPPPGVIAAAAFVNGAQLSDPCPRCGHPHRRVQP